MSWKIFSEIMDHYKTFAHIQLVKMVMDQYFFIILSLNTFTDVRIEEIQSVETCYVVCKNPID